jgi:hypothetical protein
MDDEPKTAAEMKEIRLNRKLAQDAEGIKAASSAAFAALLKRASPRKPPSPRSRPRRSRSRAANQRSNREQRRRL